MDFVDLLRSAWLVLVCGAAYAAVFFRRVVMGQKHPLDWPVDIEVRNGQLVAQGTACWQVQEICTACCSPHLATHDFVL